jgi:type II secretory pathway component PulF
LLGILVAARLPLERAVEATSQALADRNVARACPHLVHAVTSGTPLAEALDRSMHFDRMIPPMVAWGEQHGLLEDALVIASGVLRERLEGYAVMLRRVIPVISLAIIAAFIAGVAVVGFLLPLLNLVSALTPGGGGMVPRLFGIW